MPTAVSIRDRALFLQEFGYTVDLVHMQVEPDEMARRMAGRFLKTGRLIALDYFNSIGERRLHTYHTLSKEGIFAETANIDANTRTYGLADGSGRLFDEAATARPAGPGENGDSRPAADGGSPQGDGVSQAAETAVTGEFGNATGPQALAPGSLQGQVNRPAGGRADMRSVQQRQGPPSEQLEGRMSVRAGDGQTVQGQYDAGTGVTRRG